jgi:hypothetical protein
MGWGDVTIAPRHAESALVASLWRELFETLFCLFANPFHIL